MSSTKPLYKMSVGGSISNLKLKLKSCCSIGAILFLIDCMVVNSDLLSRSVDLVVSGYDTECFL